MHVCLHMPVSVCDECALACHQQCEVHPALVHSVLFLRSRLVMTTHRDLEALKRLNYRKAKPVVKAPLPYTSKGAGTVPHGEPSWKGL